MKKIISGPCSVESNGQLYITVKQLTLQGINHIRCGVWKPRTKPGGFEGLGEEGLKIIKSIKYLFPQITTYVEIANKEQYDLCEKYGIDAYWIGSRTVTNPFSVEELSSIIDPKRTVLIKNPINPDINLWAGAVERFKNKGFENIKLIFRGFNTEIKSKYRNAPLWEIPLEMKKYLNLDIYIDPSHIAGNSHYLKEIIERANFLGFSNLFIETHYNPSEALTDKDQQISPADLKKMLLNTNTLLAIDYYRDEIDSIDNSIFNLLKMRFNITDKIGEIKNENNVPIVNNKRFEEIINSKDSFGFRREFVTELYNVIHNESVKKQNNHE